ncbi:AAA-like domain-containing protein [Acaryochloris sp. IP29b_bin.137]|uniref:AAA-like domain-containing protein n=1 Tax=Acaryochloris sp. IP29b_bin.137 TaxID=2969217 RepID=UPI00260D9858|nr:AAA-like domain-containing protein [Acaryochloris sp. IP29b_bin.137]
MKPQQWDKFLKQTAQEFGITGKVRDIFLTRFAYENWRKPDKEIWPMAQSASLESYKKQMTAIYAAFTANPAQGCTDLNALSKGPGKFNVLRDWLQETRYAEWIYTPSTDRATNMSILNYRTPLPAESPFYIERPPTESDCWQAIQQPGALIRIKAPAQMGKTSLLRRLLFQARMTGYQVVYLNFLDAETSIFSSLDKVLQWFCANICRELGLALQFEQYWAEDIYGSLMSCKSYVQGYLLPNVDNALVLGLDNVDRLFEYPLIAQDFLPMLRSWNEEANTQAIWQKIRLVLAHATEIYIDLDVHQSPFNVGWPIKLSGFNVEQLRAVAQLYQLESKLAALSPRFFQDLDTLLGGHPHLVHLTFDTLRRRMIPPEELLQQAPTQSGIYGEHLRGLWTTLQRQPQLAAAMQRVIADYPKARLEPIQAYQLESMGLVHLVGDCAQPSCELYRQYFANRPIHYDSNSAGI